MRFLANVFANFVQIRHHSMNGLTQIVAIDFVVTIKHAPGGMSRDRHDDALWDTTLQGIVIEAVACIVEDEAALHISTV